MTNQNFKIGDIVQSKLNSMFFRVIDMEAHYLHLVIQDWNGNPFKTPLPAPNLAVISPEEYMVYKLSQ